MIHGSFEVKNKTGLIQDLKLAVSHFLYTVACRYLEIQLRDGYCTELHHLSSLSVSLRPLGDLLNFLTGLFLELLLACRVAQILYAIFGMSSRLTMLLFQHFGCR